jgi:hypothetical protein
MFTERELPCDFMMRASNVALNSGDVEVSRLLLEFSNEWSSIGSRWGSAGPLSWRMAKITGTSRAAIALAEKYTQVIQFGETAPRL